MFYIAVNGACVKRVLHRLCIVGATSLTCSVICKSGCVWLVVAAAGGCQKISLDDPADFYPFPFYDKKCAGP